MASNLSTPRSVREAPKATRTFLHETRGPSRRERRAGGWATIEGGVKRRVHVKRPNLYQRYFLGWSFADRYPTDNEPYRKSP